MINAGNLTTDENGYQYEYDYKNRIVKITKNSITKAEFSYDALGRRIRKIACFITNHITLALDMWFLLSYDAFC